ncbi:MULTISPECIES: hypothetical protein [Xenorhabdus]|nr:MULTISPECIES: hypothetical protein [Xenorhabdus]
MSFDLKIGLPHDRYDNIGTLSNFQNKTTIKEIVGFVCGLMTPGLGSFNLMLIVSCDEDHCQKTVELLSKEFYVTVDNRTYKLNVSDILLPLKVNGTTITVVYDNNSHGKEYSASEAINVCSILKDNIGKTKHFRFGWYDK